MSSARQRVAIILCLPGFSHASQTKAVIARTGVSTRGAVNALRGSCALQPLRAKEEATAHFLSGLFHFRQGQKESIAF